MINSCKKNIKTSHSWWPVSAGWFLSAQVNQWLGSWAQSQLSCWTLTLCGVHVMCGRQWQTCGFCVSVWAGLHWAIGHMFGLCVQPLSPCFLGVTCAFVLKGGEPCGLRDAYSHADYMFSVSSCLSKPAPDATRTRTQRRGEKRVRAPDFPLLMENILSISQKKKKVSFICFLPASFCFGFFV